MKITKENKTSPIFRVLYIIVSLLAWFAVYINITSIIEYNIIYSFKSIVTALMVFSAILLTYVAILGRAPEWLHRELTKHKNVKNNENS